MWPAGGKGLIASDKVLGFSSCQGIVFILFDGIAVHG